MPELGAHVKPEPIEVPEPQPVTARDLVRGRALLAGWRVLCAEGDALCTFASFKAGVEAHEAYLREHSGFGSWRGRS
jgi:hypothetical protein